MKTHEKKICILVFANIAADIRVQRQIESTRKRYQVDVMAHEEWQPPERARYISLPKTKICAFSANQRPDFKSVR
jgi:hypothetical protein